MWFGRARNNAAMNNSSSNHSGRRGVPSILAAGFKVEGDIVSDGEVHVLGQHSGNIVARALTLGEGGVITGSVEAESAIINGTLSGRLSATSVVLGKHAAVTADIVYVSMRVEPGASYEGYSRRVDAIETFAAEQMQLSPPLRQQIERLRSNGEIVGNAD